MQEIIILDRYDISDFGAGTVAENKAIIKVNETMAVTLSHVFCTDKTEMVSVNGIKFPMNVWQKISGSFDFEDFVTCRETSVEAGKALFLDEIKELVKTLDKAEKKNTQFESRQRIIIDGEEFDLSGQVTLNETQKLIECFILKNLNSQFLNKIMLALCKDYTCEEDVDLINLLK